MARPPVIAMTRVPVLWASLNFRHLLCEQRDPVGDRGALFQIHKHLLVGPGKSLLEGKALCFCHS